MASMGNYEHTAATVPGFLPCVPKMEPRPFGLRWHFTNWTISPDILYFVLRQGLTIKP